MMPGGDVDEYGTTAVSGIVSPSGPDHALPGPARMTERNDD